MPAAGTSLLLILPCLNWGGRPGSGFVVTMPVAPWLGEWHFPSSVGLLRPAFAVSAPGQGEVLNSLHGNVAKPMRMVWSGISVSERCGGCRCPGQPSDLRLCPARGSGLHPSVHRPPAQESEGSSLPMFLLFPPPWLPVVALGKKDAFIPPGV